MQEKRVAYAARAQELQASTSKALTTADAFVQSAHQQLQQLKPGMLEQLQV